MKRLQNSSGMVAVNSLRDGISHFYMGYLKIKKRITISEFSMCVLVPGSCTGTEDF